MRAPKKASMRFSVKNCLSRRARPLPSASRSAISLPGRKARQEKAGEIGACNQQQKRDCGEQQEQRESYVTRERFLIWDECHADLAALEAIRLGLPVAREYARHLGLRLPQGAILTDTSDHLGVGAGVGEPLPARKVMKASAGWVNQNPAGRTPTTVRSRHPV